MKRVFTHDDIVLLQAAKNFLSLHGIDAFVKDEHTIPNGARHGIENTFLELWVLSDRDSPKARELIATQFENPEPRPTWTCTRCDEVNAGSFDFCWKCQSLAQRDA